MKTNVNAGRSGVKTVRRVNHSIVIGLVIEHPSITTPTNTFKITAPTTESQVKTSASDKVSVEEKARMEEKARRHPEAMLGETTVDAVVVVTRDTVAADTTDNAMVADVEGAETDTGDMVVAVTLSTDGRCANMDGPGTRALCTKETTTTKWISCTMKLEDPTRNLTQLDALTAKEGNDASSTRTRMNSLIPRKSMKRFSQVFLTSDHFL